MVNLVISTHHHRGSGGVYKISGNNHAEVREKAEEIYKGIDFMRSPNKIEIPQSTGALLIEITYYGLD